jgi:hypothetical protein
LFGFLPGRQEEIKPLRPFNQNKVPFLILILIIDILLPVFPAIHNFLLLSQKEDPANGGIITAVGCDCSLF